MIRFRAALRAVFKVTLPRLIVLAYATAFGLVVAGVAVILGLGPALIAGGACAAFTAWQLDSALNDDVLSEIAPEGTE